MSLLRTAKAEVLSPGFFVNSALFSLVYALLFVFISNHKLFTYSIDHYGIYTTYKLLLNGVLGLPNSLSRLDLVFFVITSILVGLNFALIIKTLDRLKGQKIRLSVGGGAVLALVWKKGYCQPNNNNPENKRYAFEKRISLLLFTMNFRK